MRVQPGHPALKKTIRKLKQRRRQRERQKKQVGLDWQNNSFARTSSFFVQFVAVIIRLQCESAKFHVFSGIGTQNNNFFFPFPEL